MTEPADRRVVQCNYTEATKIAPAGARAYLVRPNPGNGNDRIEILVRSHGGRWVHKWEDIRRLDHFRVKVLPPEHPLHGEANGHEGQIWPYEPDRWAEILTAAATRERHAQLP